MRSRGSAWVPLVWALLPLVFFAVFFAWPVGSMVGRGLFPGGSPDLSALPEVLGRGRTLRVLGFTVGIIPSLNIAAGLIGFCGIKGIVSFANLVGFKLWAKPFTRQENTVIQSELPFSASGIALKQEGELVAWC